MYIQQTLLLAMHTATAVHSFTLYFSSGPCPDESSSYFLNVHGTGEQLGIWTGSVADGCHSGYVADAQGVLVKPTGEDYGTSVIFYRGSDCNWANYAGHSEGGCMNLHDAGSFQVVEV